VVVLQPNQQFHQLRCFLQEKGVKALENDFKVVVKVHPKYPNLHMLKYNQIESPMFEPAVQACRGIILDADNDWSPVCYVLNKFFNQQESNAATIDWSSVKTYTKEDGSLIQLFWYDDRWNMTTSGSPDGEGNVGDWNFTFNELFWQTWKELQYSLPHNKDLCYAFELCSKYNRIVVQHDKPRIVLLAARNIKLGVEVDPQGLAEKNGWECVQQHNLTNLPDIMSSLSTIDPYDKEGYVVCDKNFNRVKLKAPQYVAIHHVIGNMSKRNLLEVVRRGETEELLAHFPEFQKQFNEIREKYDSFVCEIEEEYEKIKDIDGQKEFAAKAVKSVVSGTLFGLRAGKFTSVRESFAKMYIRNLESLLGLNNE